MNHAIHGAGKLLAAFLPLGGRLRNCGRNVTDRLLFVIGMTSTAVLVSLFALSTPLFAQSPEKLKVAAIDDVVAGDEGWIIAIDDVAADAGGWITVIDDAAVEAGGGIAAYAAEAGGGFAAFGDVATEAGGGIAAFGKVEEEIDALVVEEEAE